MDCTCINKLNDLLTSYNQLKDSLSRHSNDYNLYTKNPTDTVGSPLYNQRLRELLTLIRDEKRQLINIYNQIQVQKSYCITQINQDQDMIRKDLVSGFFTTQNYNNLTISTPPVQGLRTWATAGHTNL